MKILNNNYCNENINTSNGILNNFTTDASRICPGSQRHNSQKRNASLSKPANTDRCNKSHFNELKDHFDNQICSESNIPPEFIESKAMHDLNRKYNKLKLLFKKEKKFYRETIHKMVRQNEEITERIFDLEQQLEH